MTYKIRECKTEDAKSICKLNACEMGYEFSLPQTESKLKALLKSGKDKIYVAVVDDKVVGYVHANDYDVLYAPHMKNIMGIAVLTAFKRAGIGKALLSAVEKWARETGASGIRLVSGAARTEAHAFYRRCGYSGDKQQINFKKSVS